MLSVKICREVKCNKIGFKGCKHNLKPVCLLSGRAPRYMGKCPKEAENAS